jgi:restriction endonuclease Mrr
VVCPGCEKCLEWRAVNQRLSLKTYEKTMALTPHRGTLPRRVVEEQWKVLEEQWRWEESQRQLRQKVAEEERRREESERQFRQREAEEQRRREEKERRFRQRTLDELLSLTPTEFEHYTGSLLESIGYQSVEHSGGPGDLAADLRCRDQDGHHVIVQCKRWAPWKSVPSSEIQKFIGMVYMHHGADRGVFVTTSGFTGDAQVLGLRHGIELWDGRALAELIQKHAPIVPESPGLPMGGPDGSSLHQPESAFCTSCGTEVSRSDSYCHLCGVAPQRCS